MPSSETYSENFYSKQRGGSLKSAAVVMPIVLNLVKPKSIIDVGCGVGTWLAAASSMNPEIELLGIEGEWVRNVPKELDHLRIEFRDLEKPLHVDRYFDLAMCLEVAEHLSTDRAEALVQDLCRLAPVVFFGAAIPGQGGDDHINEQWQSYWAALFKQNEYLPYDTVRPKVWCNAEVEYFYRQNPLLYVHESAAYLVKTIFPCTMISVIHPICYATHSRPSPRNLIRKFPGAIGQAIRRRIRL